MQRVHFVWLRQFLEMSAVVNEDEENAEDGVEKMCAINIINNTKCFLVRRKCEQIRVLLSIIPGTK